jgi:phage baseplate assembly protein gpV
MFKKALVSGSISVFIGILVMSVSVAFGAQIPTEAPPDGMVHPTFSGLSIGQTENFKIVPGGTIDSISIKSDGVTFFTNNQVGEIHDVVISNGSLQTKTVEGVENFEGYVDSTVTISSRKWGGTSLDPVPETSSSISLTPSAKGGSVTLNAGDNSFEVANDEISTVGSFSFDGDLSSSEGPLNVVGDLTIEGGSIIANGEDGIETYLVDYENGGQANVSWPFKINDNVEIIGRVLSDLTVEGDLKFFDGPGPQPTISGVLSNVLGFPVTSINFDADKLVVDGDLTVAGHLKAESIGIYQLKSSITKAVNTGSSGTVTTPACDAGGTIVDCSMEAYKTKTWNGFSYVYSSLSAYSFMTHNINTKFNDNKCEVKAKNILDGDNTRYLKAVATCFYPNL